MCVCVCVCGGGGAELLVQFLCFHYASIDFIFYFHAAVENLIIEDTNKSNCGFFVHPGETIKLPFKYQAFRLPSVSVSEICSPGFVKSRKVVKVKMCVV